MKHLIQRLILSPLHVALRARARIETIELYEKWKLQPLPSARGHELKQKKIVYCRKDYRLPSARGHELKPRCRALPCVGKALPSARGHELKHRPSLRPLPSARGHELKHSGQRDCPFGEAVALRARARIETCRNDEKKRGGWLPSARGHELKPSAYSVVGRGRELPSARGHELKHSGARLLDSDASCPPREGTN